jgi:hypothetical protein
VRSPCFRRPGDDDLREAGAEADAGDDPLLEGEWPERQVCYKIVWPAIDQQIFLDRNVD